MIRITITGLVVCLAMSSPVRADDLVGAKDRAFVGTSNQQCLFASRLAGAASSKAVSAEIKTASATEAVRQLRVCMELKRIADKWQIGTPGTLERPFSEDYDRIVGLSGPAFDAEYRSAMARSTATVEAAAADEISSGLNPDLRAFAAGPMMRAAASDTPSVPNTP